jgi:hypothetical protein
LQTEFEEAKLYICDIDSFMMGGGREVIGGVLEALRMVDDPMPSKSNPC